MRIMFSPGFRRGFHFHGALGYEQKSLDVCQLKVLEDPSCLT